MKLLVCSVMKLLGGYYYLCAVGVVKRYHFNIIPTDP
jgi:hypothetical protein